VRLECIGNLITFAAAIFVLTSDDIDPGQVGLIITYALQITQVLTWMVRMTAGTRFTKFILKILPNFFLKILPNSYLMLNAQDS
jgi:ABC-type multidrug transport system fused ATPase/permease subunit